MEKCENCRFVNLTGNEWYCRRYPPQNDVYSPGDGPDIDVASMWNFPSTKPDEWCGEYGKKKED